MLSQMCMIHIHPRTLRVRKSCLHFSHRRREAWRHQILNLEPYSCQEAQVALDVSPCFPTPRSHSPECEGPSKSLPYRPLSDFRAQETGVTLGLKAPVWSMMWELHGAWGPQLGCTRSACQYQALLEALCRVLSQSSYRLDSREYSAVITPILQVR